MKRLALATLMMALLFAAAPATAQQSYELNFENINYSFSEPEPGFVQAQEEIAVTLQPAAPHTITVEVVSEDTTAHGDEPHGPFNHLDYVPVNATAVFTPGTTRVTVPMTILGDDFVENTERLATRLENPTGAGAALGADAEGQVTITDTDMLKLWLESPGSATEGESIPVNLVMSHMYDYDRTFIIRTGALLGTETRPYRATAHSDYQHTSVTVRVQPYTLGLSIDIPTHQDDETEGFEHFNVELLKNGCNLAEGCDLSENRKLTLWIIDDETPQTPGFHTTTVINEPKPTLRKKAHFVPETDEFESDPESSEPIFIWMTQAPTEPVTLRVIPSGDEDLRLYRQRNNSHTFTPERWGPLEIIPLADEENDDALAGTKTLTYELETDDPYYGQINPGYTVLVERDDDEDPQGRKTDSLNHNSSPLMASVEYAPYRHDQKPFWVLLSFTQPLTGSYKRVHENLWAAGGQVGQVHRYHGSSELWAVELLPATGPARPKVFHLKVNGDIPCGAKGGLCSQGGNRLKNTLWLSIAHPDTEAHLPVDAPRAIVASALDRTIGEAVDHVTVTVLFKNPLTRNGSFKYTTHNQDESGFAKQGKDYVGQSGTVEMPAGSNIALIEIDLVEDEVSESDEKFSVLFYDADGFQWDGANHYNLTHNVTVTIVDDD